MLILKWGGAAITDKTRPNTARPEVIRALAATLVRYPQPLVLVHGAGSFGHIIAEEHQLHRGYQAESQRQALVNLQIQLHELNRIVVEGLCAAGLPAMAVHPASMCLTENGRITQFFGQPVRRMLDMGLLPVLYGDCVWDEAQGFSILSGDQLMIHLANDLNADRVAFGTNVDGVLDEHNALIPRLSVAHLRAGANISDNPQGAARADVTGGMLGKLSEIARLTHPQARVWVFNLNQIQELERLLSGAEDVGTLITTAD